MTADTRSPQHKPRLASMGRVTITAKGSTMTNPSRDDALIAEKKRLADDLERLAIGGDNETKLCMRKAAALLRGDEPAKPDRYVEVAREFLAAWGERVLAVDQGEYDGDKRFQAAAAVLRKHFAPPSEVVEAAKYVKREYHPRERESAHILADFILKGDV